MTRKKREIISGDIPIKLLNPDIIHTDLVPDPIATEEDNLKQATPHLRLGQAGEKTRRGIPLPRLDDTAPGLDAALDAAKEGIRDGQLAVIIRVDLLEAIVDLDRVILPRAQPHVLLQGQAREALGVDVGDHLDSEGVSLAARRKRRARVGERVGGRAQEAADVPAASWGWGGEEGWDRSGFERGVLQGGSRGAARWVGLGLGGWRGEGQDGEDGEDGEEGDVHFGVIVIVLPFFSFSSLFFFVKRSV